MKLTAAIIALVLAAPAAAQDQRSRAELDWQQYQIDQLRAQQQLDQALQAQRDYLNSLPPPPMPPIEPPRPCGGRYGYLITC